LGVLQAATEIFQMLCHNNPILLTGEDEEKEIREIVKVLRYAALLHDIGHLPFSHASEKVLLKEEKKHEDIGSYIIRNYHEIREVLERDKVEPELISSIITGEHVPPKFELVKKIISGEFDADRTDYLLRDSYMCGVEYGRFDYERFIHSFELQKGNEGQWVIYIRDGNIHAVEALVLARYHYYTQVVFHRTRRSFDKIFELYLEEKFKEERNKLLDENIDLDDFWLNFDDYFVMDKIKKDALAGDNFARILLRIEHLKPVYSTKSHASEGEVVFAKRIKNALFKEGFKENEDFFSILLQQEIHKLTTSSDEGGSYEQRQKNMYDVISRQGEKLGNFLEHSSLLKKFQDPIKIIYIYALSSKAEEIFKVINELKQSENEVSSVNI
jgi:hypothetical protein